MTGEGTCNVIKHGPNAPQLACCAAEYGNDVTVNDAHVNCVDSFFGGDFFAVEILHHELFVSTCNCFHEHIAILFNVCCRVSGNILGGVAAVLIEYVSLLLDEVDSADYFTVLNKRNGERAYVLTEGLGERIENATESCFVIVKFVNEESLGELCLGCIIPCELGTNFDTCFTVNNDYGTVSNASSLQNFAGEIQITGGVDYIDFNILPHQGSDRSGNRDVASCLFGVVVANGVSGANVAQAVGLFCNIEHSLSQGGLSGAAVTQQCDVTNVLCFNLSHGKIPVFVIPFVCSPAPKWPGSLLLYYIRQFFSSGFLNFFTD